MRRFVIRTKPNKDGRHDIHAAPRHHDCRNYPPTAEREDLGTHENCREAAGTAAERGFEPLNGCAECTPACFKTL